MQLLWPFSDRVFGLGMGNYYDSELGSHPTLAEVLWRVTAISTVGLLVFGPILLAAIWVSRQLRGYQEEKTSQGDPQGRQNV